MRRVQLALAVLALFVVSVAPVRAQFWTIQAESARAKHAAELDRLFASLKRSSSEQEAKQLAKRIWSLWYDSGNDDVDLMMRQARQSFTRGKHKAAIARIDQALRLEPRYAEAWNLRATIHFYMGEDEASVADIERTLALEPRHFGALAGLMMINMRAENWSAALKSLQAALKVHPFLNERSLLPRLEELAKGRAL